MDDMKLWQGKLTQQKIKNVKEKYFCTIKRKLKQIQLKLINSEYTAVRVGMTWCLVSGAAELQDGQVDLLTAGAP